MDVSLDVGLRRWPWASCVFLGSAVVMVLLQLVWAPSTFLDLSVYRAGAGLVLHGHPLYGATFGRGLGFTYPPVTAMLLIPLWLGSLRADEITVTLVNVCLVAVLAHCATRCDATSSHATRRERSRVAWLAAALGLWMFPVTSAIGSGQIDVLIAVLVIADLVWGSETWWGGMLIGIAAACKLTPLIFIAYLALSRHPRMAWRAGGVFTASIVISFIAAFQDARAFWTGGLLNTSHITGTRTAGGRGPADQSLHGLLLRTDPALAHHPIVWMTICALVAITGLTVAVNAARHGQPIHGYLITAVTGLLICPITWAHHGVIAIPGVLWLTLTPRHSTPTRILTALALTAASWIIKPLITTNPTAQHLGLLGSLIADSYVITGLTILTTTTTITQHHARRRAVRGGLGGLRLLKFGRAAPIVRA